MRNPPLASRASGKLALFLLLLVIIFNVFIMPGMAGGNKVVPLDIQFAYSPDDAYVLIEGYGEGTRSHYRTGLMTLDVLYPIVYTLFMSVALMVLFPGKWMLARAPYLVFAADIFENAGIIAMLSYYPQKLTVVAALTSFFTTFKWTMALILTMILLFGLVKKLFIKKVISS